MIPNIGFWCRFRLSDVPSLQGGFHHPNSFVRFSEQPFRSLQLAALQLKAGQEAPLKVQAADAPNQKMTGNTHLP